MRLSARSVQPSLVPAYPVEVAVNAVDATSALATGVSVRWLSRPTRAWPNGPASAVWPVSWAAVPANEGSKSAYS